MKNFMEGPRDGFRGVFYGVGIGIPFWLLMLTIMYVCKLLGRVM